MAHKIAQDAIQAAGGGWAASAWVLARLCTSRAVPQPIFGPILASILECWENTKPNLTAMSNRAQNYISIGPKFAIHDDPIHSFAEL